MSDPVSVLPVSVVNELPPVGEPDKEGHAHKNLGRPWFLMILALVCVTFIGSVGFVKHQLDRSEARLIAPEARLSLEGEIAEKTIHALGYGGFLGAAQTFMTTRDRSALTDMKLGLKTAQEALSRQGDKNSASTRHDIQAILDLYASLMRRAEDSLEGAPALTALDLMSAATALPTLDLKLQSALTSSRIDAQQATRDWALALAMIAWVGFLMALGLGVALMRAKAQRSHLAEPLLSLTQSVQNLAKGQLAAPIWGQERRDALGALARAIDEARRRLGQVPDLSVLTDDGPVRMKFEGEARSIFQATMKNIAEEFERTRANTLGLTSSLSSQQNGLVSLSSRLTDLLGQVSRQTSDSEAAVQGLTQTLIEAARGLASTQERSVTQVTKLVPFMQERAQNMAEVTHLVGKQVTQSLQGIVAAEQTMRASATKSQQTVEQLTNATNQMGEKLFATVNLMHATSKVLTEATDTAKSRFNEAVETLSHGEGRLQDIVKKVETRLENASGAEENMAALTARTEASASEMEKVVASIGERHEALGEQTLLATHRMEAIIAGFDGAQRAMADAVGQIKREGGLISSLLHELRTNNDKLLASASENSQSSFTAVQALTERSHALMQRLEVQISQQAEMTADKIDEIVASSKVMAEQTQGATHSLAQTAITLRAEQEKLASVRTRFTETVGDIGTRLEQQATATFGKTEQWASQSFSKLSSLTEQMDGMMQRLSILGQLTGTLGAVAGQLGQLVPSLTDVAAGQSGAPRVQTAEAAPFDPKLLDELSETLSGTLQKEWHEALVQIEAMHDQLAQIVIQQKDQLETRLMVMDKKMKAAAESDEGGPTMAAEQAEIMNEIVSAIGKINEHVMQLDEAILNDPERQSA